MVSSWLSLVPTGIVVLTALCTYNINIAFLCGIIAASLIATQGALTQSFTLISKHVYTQITDPDTLLLYSFLIIIACMAVLITKTGCGAAFTNKMKHYMRTKKRVEGTTIAFSLLMSVDDYLSILSVGHVMRLLTDQFGISRLRLAYLTHSLAGPLVILMPISSWVATITNQLSTAGVHTEKDALIFGDPFSVYMHTVPYMFYSLLLILSIVFIAYNRMALGPMDINAHDEERYSAPSTEKRGSLASLLVPIFTLLGTFISGTLLLPNNTFFIMFIAGSLSLCIALGYAFYEHTITLSELPCLGFEGALLMKNALITVFLAAILALFLRENLQTGLFLAQMVQTTTALHLLPVIFFCLSLACAIATGSAWGTFGLMISIAIPMLASLVQSSLLTPHDIPLLYPILGAIFSGAVCGDHISPFSETTVMTATSTQTNPLRHAYTQFFYALPALIGSAVAYFSSGYLVSASYGIQSMAPLCIGILVSGVCMYLTKQQ